MSGDPSDTTRPLAKLEPRVGRRLGVRGELVLALLPTAMVLAVLLLVETLSRQRLLFASLASSAFLIYLDPRHPTNAVKALAVSHFVAALAGVAACAGAGEGYLAAGLAMVVTIVVMIALDVVHPPAVSTALGFAFRSENSTGVSLFLLALAMICSLVLLQRLILWSLVRLARWRPHS